MMRSPLFSSWLKILLRRGWAVMRWRSRPWALGMVGVGSAIVVALSGVGDRAIAFSPWPASNLRNLPAQTEPAPIPNTVSTFSFSNAWRDVYAQMPDLPLENHYIDQTTGAPAENNTLILRLIRYHVYLKGRSPIHRLDWRLTLADYLGVNQYLVDELYPGYERLETNPMDGDIAAIRSLNRRQRSQLVDALVGVFNPNVNNPNVNNPNVNNPNVNNPNVNNPNVNRTPRPAQTGDRPNPTREPETVNPQPGDAQRLLGP